MMNYITKNKVAIISLLILVSLSVLSLSLGNSLPASTKEISTADTAWMITATALVLIMTPGLAFFYGGMVNKKNVISTMLQSFVSMALISVLWVVVGFSLSFGDSINGIIGNPSTFFMMKNVFSGDPWKLAPTIPLLAFAFFQLKFAIITPALVTGAFAGRIRFLPYLIFISLFSLLIYAPLAHSTWHPDGILFKLGVLDFAGGTVVHMSAGIAALAFAIYLRGRSDMEIVPARITYVLIGTGLLWFGWIGFNGGSAFGANPAAVLALATTATASASAAFAWMLIELIRGKKPTAMGMCIGAVVGLVAITPAAGFVSIGHSIFIGAFSSLVSAFMVDWRSKTSLDDTLDVFPCHGVGGMVGMILTGVFASTNLNSANTTGNGLFFGETHLFVVQSVAMVCVFIFVFLATMALLKFVNWITPLRASEEEEKLGLDITQHGEKL